MAVKQFLIPLLNGKHWQTSELADFLVAEKDIGTALKVDQDCYGFVSAVNLFHPRTQKLESLKEIKSFLLQSVGTNKTKSNYLSKILNEEEGDKNKVALLLNERLINIPHELSYPMNENVFEEIEYALQHDETGDKKKYFDFEHFIVITSGHSAPVDGKPAKDVKTEKKKVKTKHVEELKETGNLVDFEYSKPEDEFYEVRENFDLILWRLAVKTSREEQKSISFVLLSFFAHDELIILTLHHSFFFFFRNMRRWYTSFLNDKVRRDGP
tara:strand:+ start:130 stop:936 length:807 start_codon:yes stop_codon:yes gene_type:complete